MKTGLLTSVSLLGLLALGGPARAATEGGVPPTTYTGGGGDPTAWSDPGNWDNGVPAARQTLNFVGTTGQFLVYDDPNHPAYGSVIIESSDGAPGGIQTFTWLQQNNPGGFSASSLILGRTAGQGGTYWVNNPGATLTSAQTVVGGAGYAFLVQNAGNSSLGRLTVGQLPGSVGTVGLVVGTMADDAIVGDAGSGAFNNTGGTHNVTGNLILGNQATGVGTYTINGAASQTNVAFVPGGNGLANPPGSNGLARDSNNVVTGNNPNANGALIVGEAGTGTVAQGLANLSDPGNAVTVAGDLVLGHQTGSQGTYTLNTGALTVGGKMVIGGASQNNNQFIQHGGSVAITGANGGNPDYVGVGNSNGANSLLIGGGGGDLDNGTGTYTMHGGTLTTSLIDIGHSGVGTFTQHGGTVNASFAIWLGNCGGCNTGNSSGTYNLSGGTINAAGEQVGLFGHGLLNQSGGVNSTARACSRRPITPAFTSTAVWRSG